MRFSKINRTLSQTRLGMAKMSRWLGTTELEGWTFIFTIADRVMAIPDLDKVVATRRYRTRCRVLGSARGGGPFHCFRDCWSGNAVRARVLEATVWLASEPRRYRPRPYPMAPRRRGHPSSFIEADAPHFLNCWFRKIRNWMRSGVAGGFHLPEYPAYTHIGAFPARYASLGEFMPPAFSFSQPKGANDMNRDQVKGSAKDAAGKVQRKTGEALGNSSQQLRGAAKQAEGKAQKAVGDTQKVVKDSRRK
jgi:uncharacterized protein YjbJ (UPF0337 family)